MVMMLGGTRVWCKWGELGKAREALIKCGANAEWYCEIEEMKANAQISHPKKRRSPTLCYARKNGLVEYENDATMGSEGWMFFIF